MLGVYPTRRWVAAWWIAAAIVGPACGRGAEDSAAGPGSVRVEDRRQCMGVPWTIVVFAPTQAAGTQAIAAAFAEVERLEDVLSDYDPASELSRLSARAPTAEPVALGDDLWRVLEAAVGWRDRSGGAFDPTVGPLTTLWRQARRSGRLPAEAKLAAARQAVGPATLRLDADRRAALLLAPGMRLDLGGIGVGDAVDRALCVLRNEGIRSALVDASGDIAASAAPPGRPAWRIAIRPYGGAADSAAESLDLVDAAVTTSGDAFQAVEIAGVRYGHVVDPRTGLGVVGPAAVTIVAADCTTADALATAALVLGPEAGLELIESTPGAAGRFVSRSEGGEAEVRSARWPPQSSQISD